jgi:hypothetical protein
MPTMGKAWERRIKQAGKSGGWLDAYSRMTLFLGLALLHTTSFKVVSAVVCRRLREVSFMSCYTLPISP